MHCTRIYSHKNEEKSETNVNNMIIKPLLWNDGIVMVQQIRNKNEMLKKKNLVAHSYFPAFRFFFLFV